MKQTQAQTHAPETSRLDAVPASLFSPITLGELYLPNRIVMAPLTRNRARVGFVPHELNARYYAQRASAGLIISEATQVTPRGLGYPDTPGIYSVEQVAGWRLVTDAVHRQGGRIFLQLWHVGRISHPALQPNGDLPVAPSAVKPAGEAMTYEGPKPFVTPRALETEEIAEVVEQYRLGARNARDAGFDGVEIHAANGYLLDQFLRDRTNRRSDQYGGSIENRARMPLEVVEGVLQEWPADRVGIRISPSGSFNDMHDSDPEAVFGYFVDALNHYGLAYLHVIEASADDLRHGATPVPSGQLRRSYAGKLMVNGDYDGDKGAAAIADGEADLVAYGRRFLANPDLPERLRLGAPLNEWDPDTFYGGDERGYTDYPALSETA